jgi:hypothetical protein
MGIYPTPFLERIEPSVQLLLQRIERKTAERPVPRRGASEAPIEASRDREPAVQG